MLVTLLCVSPELVAQLRFRLRQEVLMTHISTIATVAFAFIAMGIVAMDFLAYW